MTTPSSPNPTVLPSQVEQTSPEVEKVAGRIVRTKSFLSKQLKSTVPAFAAGAVATLVAVRRSRSQDSDSELDNVSTPDE